jgi:PKD repeat protein
MRGYVLQRLLLLSLIVALILGSFENVYAPYPYPDHTPPVANAGPDQLVDEGAAVQFDGSGSTDNVGIRSYVWTFVDGTPKSLGGIAPSYIFLNPGNYTVTLTVRDAARNQDTDTMTVNVRDITPPIANAGADQLVDEGAAVQFDGSGSTDNVGITGYVWTIIDGTPKTLSGISPTYTFSNPGNYTVTLNVTDAAGNWATDTVTIAVRDITPPVIESVSQSPSGDVGVGQVVWVSANITDIGTGVKNASLIYSHDNGSSWERPLRMVYNSTNGLYDMIIVGHIYGTRIIYKITAYDNAGNFVTENNSGQYYVYTVIPELPSFLVLALFITAAMSTIIIRKKRA